MNRMFGLLESLADKLWDINPEVRTVPANRVPVDFRKHLLLNINVSCQFNKEHALS